ncbi:MAG: methyltransferase domain-containing protein [Patescibacteria group bacterium]
MKKYFFVLGSNPKLSLAEIRSLFPVSNWQILDSVAAADFEDDLRVKDLMVALGGIIKIGEDFKEFSLANRRALSEFVKKTIISEAHKKNLEGRFNFGFSFYGSRKLPGDFFKLALAVKKDLKNLGFSSRIVTSKEQVLSSVVVEQNKLVDSGLELCFFVDKNKVFVGKTLAVQAFKELSKRDFGRPNRDDHSGMIPPKLAQIMINIARGNDSDYMEKTILDPFCGSGTVLMEANLLGFKKIIGSDISERAVSDSQKNIEWINNLLKIEKKDIEIFQSDALLLSDKIEKESIDYIVCEPYLGPQRGFKDFDEVVEELNTLYSKSLDVFYDILKKDGRVVMIWPQFRANNRTWKMSPNISKFKIESLVSEEGQQKTLVYGREEQKVWREIVLLVK